MRPGDLVAANVRLDRLLREGGMGAVWIADHLTLNTQVVVKFMTAKVADLPEAIARFKREASAAAQIKSPHVVQVFDRGVTADGVPYIVMELLRGEDLGARLERGPLSVPETLQVVRHLCKALGSAHQQGIVHRDVKPSNIFLLEGDGEIFVKVLDFGIAKRVEDPAGMSGMTRTGTTMGTPSYMSPEQLVSPRDIDFRADLWSVGVVAYVCLTGSPPFTGETFGALSVAIHSARFVPPSVAAPGLPASLDGWFARALARAPDDRFVSAKEMADAMMDAVPADLRSLRPSANQPVSSGKGASATADTLLLFSGPATVRSDAGPTSAPVPTTRRVAPAAIDWPSAESDPAPSLFGSTRQGRIRRYVLAGGALAVGLGISAFVFREPRDRSTAGPAMERASVTAPSVSAPPVPPASSPPEAAADAADAASAASVSLPRVAPPADTGPGKPRIAPSVAPAVAVTSSRSTIPRPPTASAATPPSPPPAPKDRGF